jgi:hypothetical protein
MTTNNRFLAWAVLSATLGSTNMAGAEESIPPASDALDVTSGTPAEAATDVVASPAAASPVAPVPAPVAKASGGPSESSAVVLDAEAAKYAADLLGHSGGNGEGGSGTFSPSLRFYGFADFTARKYTWLSEGWSSSINDKLSFGVSHLNLYAESEISPSWKSLVEVRFLFQPDGALLYDSLNQELPDPLANNGRISSTTTDVYDSDRKLSLGGIAIQRAYLEYAVSPYLRVRAGRFLTPWGIWNVDHGSPVIIGPSKPFIIGEEFFPEAQTGFEALGTVPVGDLTLGYHVTLSNGRGPAEAYEDLDSNKAVGGRLFLRGYWLGELDVGVSGYGGTVTDARHQVVDLASQKIAWFDYSHYTEMAWAADVRWLWKGLHLQAEAALHDRAWDDGARPPAASGTGSQPNVRRVGFYTLLGYRLPWLNLMPYGMVEYYDTGIKNGLRVGSGKVFNYSLGLNIRVTASVVLKFECQGAYFLSSQAGSLGDSGALHQCVAQSAWAF